LTDLKKKRIYFFSSIEYQPRKSVPKRNDIGLVNIVKEATPIAPDDDIPLHTTPSIMDTIIQQKFVTPPKLDLNKLNDEPTHQEPHVITPTEHLAEQTSQILDDIRKLKKTTIPLFFFLQLKFSFQHIRVLFHHK
jgi:hypothetical protein